MPKLRINMNLTAKINIYNCFNTLETFLLQTVNKIIPTLDSNQE